MNDFIFLLNVNFYNNVLPYKQFALLLQLVDAFDDIFFSTALEHNIHS